MHSFWFGYNSWLKYDPSNNDVDYVRAEIQDYSTYQMIGFQMHLEAYKCDAGRGLEIPRIFNTSGHQSHI